MTARSSENFCNPLQRAIRCWRRVSTGWRVRVPAKGGHFRLCCHVLDGDRTIGVGVIEIEVLFKGRFSDVGLPGAPPV